MRIYFEERCSKLDTNFWKTISPFFSHNKFENGNHIALFDNNDIMSDQLRVAEIFNDYFSTTPMSIGFDDSVKSATEAINKHSSHPSVLKIQGNRNPEQSFSFHLVHTQQVSLALKMINPRRATRYNNLPGKIIRIAYLELSYPFTLLIKTSISMKSFSCTMSALKLVLLSKRMIVYLGITLDPSMCWQLYLKYSRTLWTINLRIISYQS